MDTIKEMHARWAAQVMPQGASQVQRQEMERAFYSGFFASLNWQLLHLANMPDADAVIELQQRHYECEAYFKTLGQATTDITRS